MKALVVYGTTEGHTRKIAVQLAEWLKQRQFVVQTLDSSEVSGRLKIDDFDLCVLAGSLHMGQHQPSLVAYVRDNLEVLKLIPTFFVSVSATASRNDPTSVARANECVELFVQQSGLRPTMTKPIGGALLYSKYNFILRLVMKKISEKEGGPTDTSRDYVLTDWVALEDALDNFLKGCSPKTLIGHDSPNV